MNMRSISLIVFAVNIVMAGLATAIYKYTGADPFGEDGFITFFSALQLLIIAWVAKKICKKRAAQRSESNVPKIWIVIAIGFLFLAADEMFKIHENIDYGVHDILGLEETALSDRIDDILVGIYGIVGIVILYVNRSEFLPHKKSFPFFILGFALLFIMVAFDIVTNRNDLLPLFFNPELATAINACLALAEDTLKIFAEASFILAFVTIWRQSEST